MKKILAVLIAILMLSACGKEPAPEAPVTEPENNSVSEPASEPEEKIPFDAKNVLI